MKVIGLTGGIGCGKSFVAKIASHFFPVLHINTDEMARQQMKKGGISYNGVIREFSQKTDDLLLPDGEINRPVLSKIVFSDPEALKKLDEITHPAVISEIQNIIKDNSDTGEYEAVLIESALVFESGIDRICDEVWYVHAPKDQRVNRLMESRGYSREKIDSVLSGQLSEDEFIKKSDRIIENCDSVDVEEMVKIIAGILI
ncbi:MAG: dephospho-CoA kinase [Lachnospiraceae bacterium]|nr:dephospho-CoA kinase [Lachnospiraceae bacterium]